MIHFFCPGCHKLGEAADVFAGQVVTCPSCLAQMQVPATSTVTPEAGSKSLVFEPPRDDGKIRFLCPRCRKRQRALMEAVGSVTICRRCRQRMYVPPISAPGAPLVLAQRSEEGKKEPSEYYYVKNGISCGPVQASLLRRMAKTGVLQATDLIWKKGMSDWIVAARLHGLFPKPKKRPPIPTPEPSVEAVLPAPEPAPAPASAPPQPAKPAASPVLRAVDLIARGMAHAEKGEVAKAFEALNEAIRMEPRNAQAYASRAIVHGQLRGDHRQAIIDLNEAIRHAPQEAVLYEFRGLYYRAMCEPVKGAQDERKAAELAKRGPSQIVIKLGGGPVYPLAPDKTAPPA